MLKRIFGFRASSVKRLESHVQRDRKFMDNRLIVRRMARIQHNLTIAKGK